MRFEVTARRHARHVWHVYDRARETVDLVAFRPEGIGPSYPPVAIRTVTTEALAHHGPDLVAKVEQTIARKVGLRIP